jgi:hypothetical protein
MVWDQFLALWSEVPFPSFLFPLSPSLAMKTSDSTIPVPIFFYLCLVTVEDLPHFAAPSQFHGLMHGWHFILFLGTLMIDPLFVT